MDPKRAPGNSDDVPIGHQRRAWSAAWALLLALWIIAAWNAQSGFSSSGPMNMHFAPVLLLVVSAVASVLAPVAARLLGTRLHLRAAFIVVTLTCWWQFWLPATMKDMAYSIRYDIPNPFIWPGPPGSAPLALSLALWLIAPLAQWTRWQTWTCWILSVVSTIAMVLTLDTASYASVPWQTALVCGVVIIVLIATRSRLSPTRSMLRWLMLWASGMVGLVVFWFATETVAGWVPYSLNAWFVGWLYS